MEKYIGILDVLSSGAGFIRRREDFFLPGQTDIFVDRNLIREHGLRAGDEIKGEISVSDEPGKKPELTEVISVNNRSLDEIKTRPHFNRLNAVHPEEQLKLSCDMMRLGEPDYTNRIIDLFCPFGKGQRALIVSPPKAGKTMVLQAIAEGITKNYPDCTLYILLVDERPEEVTEIQACGYGEVISSSFDFPPERHIKIAEMTLQRARRHVELGENVVIILDSITRLSRTYNTVQSGSGRTLSGGLDALSLERPKHFLGSARKIDEQQGGGSLTIIGTALIDTGSRMDQVIFEEFKGTGNSELVLSRELADRRIFPAFDLNASATRREELLFEKEALTASSLLRREMAGLTVTEAMTKLLWLMKQTDSNEELIRQVLSKR
ncbi:MAG TPA: transcription termination factor Rho [Bacteroidetes bacterium]|nr:transcription termination factor Rho [Bacteroidota bacterium]